MQSKCPCRKDSEHLRGFDEKHGTAQVLQRMLWMRMLLEVSRAEKRKGYPMRRISDRSEKM